MKYQSNDKVSGATQRKFQFNVENTSDKAVRMAILPSYLECKAWTGKEGILKADVRALNNAGYPTHVILEDLEVKLENIPGSPLFEGH